MLSEGAVPEYLFSHARGTVGILRKLIQKACRRAIETGEEEITISLLDTLTITRKEELRLAGGVVVAGLAAVLDRREQPLAGGGVAEQPGLGGSRPRPG